MLYGIVKTIDPADGKGLVDVDHDRTFDRKSDADETAKSIKALYPWVIATRVVPVEQKGTVAA